MKPAAALLASICLGLVPTVAMGAGTAVLIATPRETSIPSGGTMIIDLFIDISRVTSGLGIAGWTFDILGHVNGTLAGDVNDHVYYAGVHDGTPVGPDLLDFAGAQLPPLHGMGTPFIGTVAYTDSSSATADYTVSLAFAEYVQPGGFIYVYNTAIGGMSRSSLTSSVGDFHLMEFEILPFQVIVPGPASLAVFALVPLVRRRARVRPASMLHLAAGHAG